MIHTAPRGDSVPLARTSYPGGQSESRAVPGSCDQTSHESWLTPERAAAALVRAAKRSRRPLEADQLAASAGIGHILGATACRRIIADLARAGELVCERRQSPSCLWEVIEVYSSPGPRR